MRQYRSRYRRAVYGIVGIRLALPAFHTFVHILDIVFHNQLGRDIFQLRAYFFLANNLQFTGADPTHSFFRVQNTLHGLSGKSCRQFLTITFFAYGSFVFLDGNDARIGQREVICVFFTEQGSLSLCWRRFFTGSAEPLLGGL